MQKPCTYRGTRGPTPPIYKSLSGWEIGCNEPLDGIENFIGNCHQASESKHEARGILSQDNSPIGFFVFAFLFSDEEKTNPGRGNERKVKHMPIKGFADQTRIPRVGKIHLGIKQKSAKSDSEYPRATDYFVVNEDDSTSESAVKAFRSVYGEKPKAIKVMFPSNQIENFFPQYLKAYRRTGGGNQLYCWGDGENANRLMDSGEWAKMPCLYKECPIYAEGKCKELGQLQFFLPDVPMLGIWQVDTCATLLA